MTLLVPRHARQILVSVLLTTALAAFAAGCVGDPIETPDDTALTHDADTVEATVTYERDLRPILEDVCLECHVDGGVGPFPLETWDQVEPLAPAIAAVVVAREMPPKPSDPVCDEVACPPGLSDEEVALFEIWAHEGFPEGEPPSPE